MRLLDLVVQSREPLIVLPHATGARQVTVSGPSDFAQRVVQCPQRYVLADDLTACLRGVGFCGRRPPGGLLGFDQNPRAAALD
jgi:hypothetical protein